MKPQQQRGLARRNALIRSAAEIAVERGFSSVSHRAVAHRAGVPLGSTTYYFSSLDDLLAAATEMMIDEWLTRGFDLAKAASPGSYSATDAARLVTIALLPAENYARVLCHYEQLLSAARYPAVAVALNQARPRLEHMVHQILATTGFAERVSARVALAAVDGATLGALSEGRVDLVHFVTDAVSELLGSTSKPRAAIPEADDE